MLEQGQEMGGGADRLGALAMTMAAAELAFVRPLATARGELSHRPTLVVRLVRAHGGTRVQGQAGYGECAPLEMFSPETFDQAAGQMVALAARLARTCGPQSLEQVEPWLLELAALLGEELWPAVRFALETAALDLLAREAGVSLAHLLAPGMAQERVAVNATLGALPTELLVQEACQRVAEGYGCLKIKVGAGGDDVTRVRAVRKAVGPGVTLRLDANGAWEVGQAAKVLEALAGAGIEYIEQPVASDDLEGLRALRAMGLVAIAADESARSEEDVRRLVDCQAVDVLVLKPALVGGLLATRRLGQMGRQAGMRCVVTTALEGAVGRAAAAHLAASQDLWHGPFGLATGLLFPRDIALLPDALAGGHLAVRGPGLGVVPDRLFGPEERSPLAGRAPVHAPPAPQARPVPLWHQARYRPERLALVLGEERWTYGELFEGARAFGAWLVAQGVEAGGRVAIIAPNGRDFVLAAHGASLVGAVLAPLHPRWTSREAGALLGRLQPALVLQSRFWTHGQGDTGVAGAFLVRVLEEAVEEALGASGGVFAGPFGGKQGQGEQAPSAPTSAPTSPSAGLPADGACEEDMRVPWRYVPQALHSILFTSGTTSAPRMVALSWQNYLEGALGSALALGHLPSDRWLAVLPLCHVGGLAILQRAALLGIAVEIHERFEAPRVAEALVQGAVTLVSLVASMAWQVLEALGERPVAPTFRGMLVGGGPVPQALLEAARARAIPMAPTWGMTEAASQIATSTWEEAPHPPGAGAAALGQGAWIAAPLVFNEIALAPRGAPQYQGPRTDAFPGDGADVQPLQAFGGTGELLVRGPTLSPGYVEDFDSPEQIAPRLCPLTNGEGWFATGDWAEMEPRGPWRIVDRRADLVVRGGENVAPAEVESALQEHPGVEAVCVVGLADVHWGQRVVAVVVLAPPPGTRHACADPDPAAPLAPLSPELAGELHHWCRERLAAFKVPEQWWMAASLPQSSLGKLRREEIRARLLAQAAQGAAPGQVSG